nr:MAG TPA: hypothetical protein [Caudoviricetes sp.]
MGTIAKGGITLNPVNDAYTVLLTPSSCSISADFDGSNPALDNVKGSITVKRGTKIVPFKVNEVTYSASGIKASWSTQEVTTMPFVITQIPNTVLDGFIKFHITTQDGFNYSTEVQFSFNIVRESTMLDWVQDWEGSKTKIGGTYIMTPKLFVGKKEAVLDTTGLEPTWKEGALTGVYIGPDLLASGESSVGIYGYLKDEKIFHINADGGFIGGWTFNEGGLQSSNGVVNILSEGSIYSQNPDSEIPYWGIYANGTASFANGNVKFFSDGSAEFAGKITSIQGMIGGWAITKKQLCSGRIFLDSSEGLIGINASDIQHVDGLTGAYIFPETPDGGLKLWYSSATDFGMAGWTTGEKVFQLGSTNFIAGWSFNHQAIWTGSEAPSLTQGSYTLDSNALTIAPNGIRSSKWYVDANGTASFVGGSVKFNTENAEMFGWLMRNGRFSSKHAALISDDYDAGVYVSVADISEVSGVNLRSTISNNGGIYLYSDGANSIMRAYDKSGNIGFFLSTSGYNTISSWTFDATAIYIGSKNLSQEGYIAAEGSMALMSSGIFGYKWKFLADGSGALAGGKINWDKDGNINVDAKISANNITAGTISTASIECEGKWSLNQEGSGYLASNHLYWDNDGNLTVEGKIVATSGSIAGFKISSGCIGVESSSSSEPGSNSQENWAALTIYKDFFKVGGAKGYVMFGNDVIPSSAGGAFTAVGRIVNNAVNTYGYYGFDQANYGLFIDVTGGTKNYGIESNAALKAPAFINTKAKMLTFTGDGYTIDFSQYNIILMYYNDPNYSGVKVTLPTEYSVAQQFGVSTLPDDFATIVTFRVRQGSKNITLQGIYNHNEGVQDYEMAPGDSVTVLISKIDGFRYQILNHSS